MSTSQSEKFQLPKALGGLEEEYDVLRELGRGGTAVVYLAKDRQLGREVAIKVIRSTYVEDEEAVARLLREARTVAQLQHPNIVMLYGTRRLDDGSLALIMQYVPGRPLKAVIRAEGPLPFKMVTAILNDVVSALGFAHRQRIVHRDIKPENIYLDEEVEVARLADFGIARHWDKDAGITLPGMAIGTPTYMSPEQIDGADLDGRSDIYSLGIVGYEMLTGQQPWAGENLYSIIYKQKNENLPRLEDLRPGLPVGLGRAIQGALHKRPEERWGSPEEFLAVLMEGQLPVGVPVSVDRPSGEDASLLVQPGGDGMPQLRSLDDVEDVDDHSLTIRYRRPSEDELVAAVDEELLSDDGASSGGASSGEVNREGADLPSEEAVSRWKAGADLEDDAGKTRRRRLIGLGLFGVVAVVAFALSQPDRVPSADSVGLGEAPISVVGSESTPPPTEVLGEGEGLGSVSEEADGGIPQAGSFMPASFVVLNQGVLEGSAGRALGSPIRIQVLNAVGAPAQDALIEFVVISGGGRTEPRFVSAGPDGFVEARWFLGRDPGEDRLRVQAVGIPGGPSEEFEAVRNGQVAAANPGDPIDGSVPSGQASEDSAAGPPTMRRMIDMKGGGQRGAPSARLAEPVELKVVDGAGEAVEGATVLFQPAPGQGAVTARLVVTGADGVASTSWTLGAAAGAQILSVRIQGAPAASASRIRAVAVVASALQANPTLTSGGTHSCSLSPSGAVTCWGGNGNGQLGDDSRTTRSTPRPLSGGSVLTRLAAGFSSTCGLTAEGQALCWGANSRGQLGDGTTSSRPRPAAVSVDLSFRSIALGFAHTCALVEGGRAYCWGANDVGQLGTGDRTDALEAVPVGSGRRFRRLVVGWNHTCGISGSQTYCWGANDAGQLGNGSGGPANQPTPVALSFGLREVSAGGSHTCGVATSGLAYCWGSNRFGQLGNGALDDQRTPVPVSGDHVFRTVAAGPGHSCGLTDGGEVFCWGRNNFGQLGDGSGSNRVEPSKVDTDLLFNRLTVSGGHSCARANNGALYCWGYNSDGQLGDGSRVNRMTPVVVRR